MNPSQIFYILLVILLIYAIAYSSGLRLYVKRDTHPLANKIADAIQLLVIAVGIMFVWKGMYSLIDHLFMPHCPIIGNIIAFLYGFAIILIAGGVQTFSNFIG
jgi:hypothetical protein